MTERNNKELIDISKQLMAIKSIAGNRAGLVEAYDLVATMLLNCGKNITIEHFERNGVPSLLAYRGPQRPDNFRIMLNAHIDVVEGSPEEFKPVVKDGKLFGRGSADMKPAAVILTDLFCKYVDQVPYALGLQIVTDEESSGLNGTKYQVEQGVRADFVICGECGRLPGTYEIAKGSKGMLLAEVEFDGKPAHGAYLWRGQNALLRASTFVQSIMQRYPVPEDEVDSTTINVSSISTRNTAHTKVPDQASVKLDIRFVTEDPHFRSRQHFAALIEQIDPGARISRIVTFDQPIYADPENPLFIQLRKAAEKIEGHEFKVVRRHGTSDGRYFANVGDQACEFGIVGDMFHADGEYITLEAFDTYYKTMDLFLKGTIVSERYNTNTAAYKA